MQAVYLTECGTHAVIDAGFWPCHTSERVGGFRLLRSITAEMLVMWDRGFHDYALFRAARRRGAHVLARLPAHVQPEIVQPLPDGSYLARLHCPDKEGRAAGEHLLVRIIEYTVSDPALVGYGERHRIITTLLDYEQAPASEVAWAYHERWETLMTIDEIDTHQRGANRPLRLQKPVGVIQELYSLLLAHYVLRYLMHEAALLGQVAPTRLSFTHALAAVVAPAALVVLAAVVAAAGAVVAVLSPQAPNTSTNIKPTAKLSGRIFDFIYFLLIESFTQKLINAIRMTWPNIY